MNKKDIQKYIKFAKEHENVYLIKLVQILQDYVQPYNNLSQEISVVTRLREDLIQNQIEQIRANISRYIMALTILKENAKISYDNEKEINSLTIDDLQLKGVRRDGLNYDFLDGLLSVYTFYYKNDLFSRNLSTEIVEQDDLEENKLNYCLTTFAHNVSSFKFLFNEISSLLDKFCNLQNYLDIEENNYKMNLKQKTDINNISYEFKKEVNNAKEELNNRVEKEKEDLKNVEHKVTGHAMTLMGVLAAIVTVIVTLTATGVSIARGFSFYEQLLMLISIGIIIVSSVVLLLMLCAYFFADESRSQGAKNGLVTSAKIFGLILYIFIISLGVFFFIEKVYNQVNVYYIAKIDFKIMLGLMFSLAFCSIFTFILLLKHVKFNDGQLKIQKCKISFVSFTINLLLLALICVAFLFNYYFSSTTHNNEPKKIIEEYEIIKEDDIPKEILYKYDNQLYSIVYNEDLIHNGTLYYCEEHKTLE